MTRFSACIITLNEEENLPRALACVRGVADEIVVVDSGSKDRTLEIAREQGVALFERAWTSYEEQWNFAAACATNEWIFVLAADEELSPELRGALLQWKQREPEFAVYEMARRAWYLGAWIKHSGWYPDYQRRLYRRDSARFAGLVHEVLQFEGKPGRLNGDLLHYTVRSMVEHEEKVERYTTLAARQLYQEGKRSWRAAVCFAAPWSWFQNYFLRGGFLDGYRGAFIARMAARGVRLKYRKLGQLVKEAARKNFS